ncbi:DUF1799 domain-containing protein [Variovorax sp. GT1P44]|uniref:DUF1799 domain-containing protein n=1 Tax=Variovorax sp. GT1P44 TaxID=3443742 RepID=UPI003F483F7A
MIDLLDPPTPPTEQEARFYGLTIEQATPPPQELWPDNEDALKVFSSMNTQWHIGMAGATGLMYGAMSFLFDIHGLDRKDWPEVFDDVQVMERTALAFWRQKAEEAEQAAKTT